MNIEKHNYLNEIYGSVYDRAKEIYLEIFSTGQNAMFGWHNMHSTKNGHEMLTQFYPIPVISIEAVGEIGVDIDSVFFELRVSKEKALELDYEQLGAHYEIEVFGQNNYLEDLYHKDMTRDAVIQKIKDTEEVNIKIYARFPADVKAIALLEFWGVIAGGDANITE